MAGLSRTVRRVSWDSLGCTGLERTAIRHAPREMAVLGHDADGPPSWKAIDRLAGWFVAARPIEFAHGTAAPPLTPAARPERLRSLFAFAAPSTIRAGSLPPGHALPSVQPRASSARPALLFTCTAARSARTALLFTRSVLLSQRTALRALASPLARRAGRPARPSGPTARASRRAGRLRQGSGAPRWAAGQARPDPRRATPGPRPGRPGGQRGALDRWHVSSAAPAARARPPARLAVAPARSTFAPARRADPRGGPAVPLEATRSHFPRLLSSRAGVRPGRASSACTRCGSGCDLCPELGELSRLYAFPKICSTALFR